MNKVTAIVFCLIISATLAWAQSDADSLTDAQVAELIEQVKQMPVSRLDAALPQASFGKWLEMEAGPGAKISWAMRYANAAATDGGRDFPTCVEADVAMKNGQSIAILIGVGTPGKSGTRKPFVVDSWLITTHDSVNLRHLRDLPAALNRSQKTEEHSEVVR